MDQVRGRLSLGGISKSGMCQREGKKGHLSYAGNNAGATLICLILGAHSILHWVHLLGQNQLSRLEILSCENTQAVAPQAPESRVWHRKITTLG